MNKIRVFENFHVILWLLKDACWVSQLVIPGTILVVPTLGMAIYIAWNTRKDVMHFVPNLAVCSWLSANITWMLGEFYGFDFKTPALVFFLGGLVIILIYFLMFLKARKDKNQL